MLQTELLLRRWFSLIILLFLKSRFLSHYSDRSSPGYWSGRSSFGNQLSARSMEIKLFHSHTLLEVCSDGSGRSLSLQVMLNFLKDFEKKLGIKITCSQETEPLGTAGPLALARDKLVDASGEPFFVLNSDVISEYPLKEMIEFHKSHGGEASIMVTKVILEFSISSSKGT